MLDDELEFSEADEPGPSLVLKTPKKKGTYQESIKLPIVVQMDGVTVEIEASQTRSELDRTYWGTVKEHLTKLQPLMGGIDVPSGTPDSTDLKVAA